MTIRKRAAISALALLGAAGVCPDMEAAAARPVSRVRRVTRVRDHDGRVDWSRRLDRVAFDMKGKDGVYDVYTMRPDGTDVNCVTCDVGRGAPAGHNGNPAWHPSGDWIVFQAERRQGSPRSGVAETPGIGKNNELWLASPDGRRFHRLAWPGSEQSKGVLHPHFSADGRRLSWTEMVGEAKFLRKGGLFGYWKLRVADFAMAGGAPRLTNVREFQPGGPAFYENHGFSPDGTKLVYTSNADHQKTRAVRADIYVLDLRTGRAARLTSEGYNEHAGFTASGRKIIWMSSMDREKRGTDYWIMDADGSNKTRLTCFREPTCPEYDRGRVVAADWTESPDGTKIMALLLTRVIDHAGRIVLLDLGPDIR
jgi:Tol biopolymer transport system component